MKRREAKSKVEKERYKHLNAEFQRRARRDKKPFLRDQCKEIEENNQMGKTRDLFKKIRDTKRTFPAKMGSIKDRKWTWQKQKILRRGGKSTQKNCTKKIFTTKIITMVWLLTYSQTSCIVKSSGPYETLPNKPSGGDGILADLFQILKDDALKVLHSICQQIWKNQQWPQDWKRCFHSNRKERQWQRMCKLLHKCTHLTC